MDPYNPNGLMITLNELDWTLISLICTYNLTQFLTHPYNLNEPLTTSPQALITLMD